MSLLRGRRYNRTKNNRGGWKEEMDGQNVRPSQTAESLAAEHGVDEKTIRRDALHHDVGEQLLLLDITAVTLQASQIQRRKVGSTSGTWSESSRAGWEKPRHADVVRLRAVERHALAASAPRPHGSDGARGASPQSGDLKSAPRPHGSDTGKPRTPRPSRFPGGRMSSSPSRCLRRQQAIGDALCETPP